MDERPGPQMLVRKSLLAEGLMTKPERLEQTLAAQVCRLTDSVSLVTIA